VRAPPVPGRYLVAPPRSRQVRLFPGRPISHSWLWPRVVLRALPWDGMTRQIPAGTTPPLRSAGRGLPLGSK
jgi:hypothetical protein